MDILIIFKAIILGIIEGVTEFIPVSSTGHLILVGDLLSFPKPLADTFNIAIQLGAILAVVVLYWDIFKPFLKPRNWLSPLAVRIIIATLPALAIGSVAHTAIKTYLFSPAIVGIGLGIGGVIMIAVDRWLPGINRTGSLDDITPKNALVIGFSQCLAMWPGTSRSGATMVAGMFCGLSNETAAKFSFIIAVPVMAAAVSYDLLKAAPTLSADGFELIAIGFVVSFIVALFAIKTFLKLLQRWRLTPFGLYRIALSLIILL